MATELGVAYLSIIPETSKIGPGISQAMRGASRGADREGKRVASRFGVGFNGAIGSVVSRSAGIFAAGFAGVKVGGFLKGAIGEASNLGETLSKSAAVFGPANRIIQSFGQSAAKSIGQSEQQATAAAAQFGNMFNQLGIGQRPAANMSVQMVKLASDFASFHNADITEVLQAQEAAFRGEFDSVQRFVPTLNAAAVEQEGLRLKLAGSTKELTAQDKALATQSLMMRGAGKAAGDFSKTSGGLANQQRILSAQLADNRAELGQKLLPVATKFFTFLNTTAIPAAQGLSDILVKGDFTSQFRKSTGLEEDSPFVDFLFNLRETAITVFNEVQGGFKAFVFAWKANDGDITSSGFPGFMERLGFVARQTFGFFRAEVLPRLIQFAGYVRDTVLPIVGRLINEGMDRLGKILGTVRQAIADNRPELTQLANGIKSVARFIIEQLVPYLTRVSGTTLPILQAAIKSTADRIGWIVRGFNAIKEPVRQALHYVWSTVSGFFSNILTGSAKAFGWVPGLGDKLKGAAESFRTFRDDVNRALDGIDDEAVKVSATYLRTQQRPGSVPKTFAYGGSVTGGIPGKDSVPALLMPDEHVFTTKDVKAMGGQSAVYAFRQNLHRFAKGGAVGLDLSHSLPGAGAIRAVTSSIAKDVGRELAKTIAAEVPTGGPPGSVRSFRGKRLNELTIGRLLNAERLLGAAFHITQGSYSTSVAASGGTHSGGGAMDTNGPRGWGRAVSALRNAGFAAWHRTPSQGPWGHHIHSITIGDPSASPSAKGQVRDYLRGGNGLAGMKHGGAVVAPRVLSLDSGGYIPQGVSVIHNGTGAPEPAGHHLTRPVHVTIPVYIGDEVVRVVRREIDASDEFAGTADRMRGTW